MRNTAHAARNPRQCASLRCAHALRRSLPFTGGRGPSAVPDARRQGQRCAARQQQRPEARHLFRPVPGNSALCAGNQRHAAHGRPDPPHPHDGEAPGKPGRSAPRSRRRSASTRTLPSRENQKRGNQPHAPGFLPAPGARRTGCVRHPLRIASRDGGEKMAGHRCPATSSSTDPGLSRPSYRRPAPRAAACRAGRGAGGSPTPRSR